MDVRRRQEGAAPRLAELGQSLQPEIGGGALTRREGVRKSQQGLAEFIERPAKQAQSSCSNIGVIGRVQQIAPKVAQVLGQEPAQPSAQSAGPGLLPLCCCKNSAPASQAAR